MSDVAAEREALWTALRKAASQLPSVEERKMFGCEALFTNGAIFALVWKTGRIAVEARPRRGAARRAGAEARADAEADATARADLTPSADATARADLRPRSKATLPALQKLRSSTAR